MKIVLYKPLGEEYNIELPSVGGNEKRPENSFKKVVKKLKKLLTSFGERDIITKRELRNARNRSLKTDVEYLVNFEKRIEQATNKKGKKGVRDVLSK